MRDFGSAWQTPEGIRIGISLQELQKKLGDFKLTGLGWNYSGFVNLEDTVLSKYQGQISIQLAPDENAAQNNLEQYNTFLVDKEFSSTNPNWQPLKMKVSQITVNFDE